MAIASRSDTPSSGSEPEIGIARSRPLIARLWRDTLRQSRGRILLALYFMALYAAGEAINLKLLEPVVDRLFVARDPEMLLPVALLLIAVFAIKSAADYGQAGVMARIGLSVTADLQDRLFRKLMTLDQRFFDARPSGTLVSHFTTDAQLISNAVSNGLTRVGKDALSVVFLVALMFHQDPLLAMLVLIVLPLAAAPIDRLSRRLRRSSAAMQTETGLLLAYVQEAVQANPAIRIYAMEDSVRARASGMIGRIRAHAYRAARTRAMALPFMELIGGLAIALVIAYGGWRVIDGALTPGSFFSFVAALIAAARPIQALAGLAVTLQEGLAGAERLYAAFDRMPRVAESPDARKLAVTGGAIRFESVRFAYRGPPVLDGFDLDVAPGESVALIGRSGAGKSTVFHLLLRLYDPDAGRVAIDGQDLRHVRLADLRGAIALVAQDVVLFDDTVAANIAAARPGAGRSEIVAAAEAADADSFIRVLPAGYDTRIGEGGQTLSGGQRQRLSLARAFLKDAPILLLDEPTAALDAATEARLKTSLGRLMQGRTTLLIAHRQSFAEIADRIVLLESGRAVRSGAPSELLRERMVHDALSADSAATQPGPDRPV